LQGGSIGSAERKAFTKGRTRRIRLGPGVLPADREAISRFKADCGCAGVILDLRFGYGGAGIDCKGARFARYGVRRPGIVRQPRKEDKANCERRTARGERPQPHSKQEFPRPLTIDDVPNPSRRHPETSLNKANAAKLDRY
jgi:hypothetical protein